MAHTLSTKKRIRQSTKIAQHNQRHRSEVKTYLKNLRKSALVANEDDAKKFLALSLKKLDKLAGKGILHKNTANRLKSRACRCYLSSVSA